jgi:2-amino-4-hydroxy-6-hydroxymethyldihydropteridine diphosphokinase/dihydropteroate synthase
MLACGPTTLRDRCADCFANSQGKAPGDGSARWLRVSSGGFLAVTAYIGVGSNLGDRRENLEQAAREISQKHVILNTSPVYQNPAMVPAGAPSDWNLAYLNAVLKIETAAAPNELLKDLKRIETELGRTPSPRWAPRVIDLDILLYGNESISSDGLVVPHPGILERSFVLDPLKDLAPSLLVPGSNLSVLQRSRQVPGLAPLWMGILNLTPDSFSDGGQWNQPETFLSKAKEMIAGGAHILDLGAESTRPGATALTAAEEWQRLEKPLHDLLALIQTSAVNEGRHFFHPKISIDTRHAEVAKKALAMGAHWINDVSGLSDPAMINLAVESACPFVFMHSLSVPADKKLHLPLDADPVTLVKDWALEKIAELSARGIPVGRLIFDPGIGFGKTEAQSLEILKRISEFHELPVPILVGHSRKSFLRLWTGAKASHRDADSVGISLKLLNSGVEILRVHEPALHAGAHLAWSHL